MRVIQKKVTDSIIHIGKIEAGRVLEEDKFKVEGQRIAYRNAMRLVLKRYGEGWVVTRIEYKESTYLMGLDTFIANAERIEGGK